jgi:hypothetical protein
MQSHDCLSRSRPTGDHREALVRRSDRLVLLRLDGGDDVAHGVITSPAESGKQCPLTDHHQLMIGMITIKKIIFNSDHSGAAALQYAAADHLHWVAGGGPVERLGRWCSPVDDERLIVGIPDTDPADVPNFAIGSIQPAEDEPFLLGIQHG